MQGDIIDELSAHLEVAGAPDRAAMHIGVFLAWCVNHDLVSETLKRQHADLLLKVRVRELDGSELLVRIAAGQLLRELLSETGQRFTDKYYGNYLADYAEALGLDPDCPYGVEDSWSAYDLVAPVLTKRWRDAYSSPVKSSVVNLFSRRRKQSSKRPWLRLVR